MSPTILPFRIKIESMAGMLNRRHLYPALTSSGITRSMKVVLPLFDRPIKQTNWDSHKAVPSVF